MDGNSGSGPGKPPLIRLAAVTTLFGTHKAVDDLSLDLREREFFCLLGPSGCGKSTLLRLLAGFESADSGRIELDGRDLTGVPPHRRPLNMMFQSYALFPHLTVSGNVGYGLRMEGMARAEAADRVAAMLRLVGLEGLETRYPAQLSGGQRQRVALARALIKRPRLLLLDEPMAALDRSLRERTQAELKQLQARLGTTFLVVTHDQEEAMVMADRIGIMEAGRLVQVGSPREIYERPRTRFVARFVGEANLIQGTVIGRDGACVRLRLRDGAEVTGRAEPDGVQPGACAAVAVRPDRMTLSPGPAAVVPNALLGRVTDVAFTGAWTTFRVELGTGEVVRAARPSVAATENAAVAVGDGVTVGFPPGAASVLP